MPDGFINAASVRMDQRSRNGAKTSSLTAPLEVESSGGGPARFVGGTEDRFHLDLSKDRRQLPQSCC